MPFQLSIRHYPLLAYQQNSQGKSHYAPCGYCPRTWHKSKHCLGISSKGKRLIAILCACCKLNIKGSEIELQDSLYIIVVEMQKSRHFKYVIVGGGISALQAALILAQNQQQFILLEASNRIGGRICSLTLEQALKDCPDNKYCWLQKVKEQKIECGATWICEDHGYMLHYANKFQFNLLAQFYQGKYVIAETPQKYHYYQDSSQYYLQYSPQILGLINCLQTLRKRFESLCSKKQERKMSEEECRQLDQFYERYDNMSAFDYIRQHIEDEFLCRLLAKEASCLVGCNTAHFSVLDLFDNEEQPLVSVKYNVGIQNANIDGFRLKEGLLSICQRFKQEIQKIFDAQGRDKNVNDLIRLNSPVVQVRNKENPVEVVTQGQIYYCQKVIMALPIATFHRIKFDHLSQSKKILVNNQIESNITRMAFIFKQPFWRKHYSASVSFSHHFPMSQLVQLTPDNQQYGAIAFVFAAEGYAKWNASVLAQCQSKEGEELSRQWYLINKQKSLRIIADLFLQGDTRSDHLKEVAIFVKSMSESPYIKSTYNSFSAISTASKINKLEERVNPRGDELNLVVLGSDFSDEFNGYMQGAIRIARKKVYNLLGQKDPLERIGEIKCYRQKERQ